MSSGVVLLVKGFGAHFTFHSFVEITSLMRFQIFSGHENLLTNTTLKFCHLETDNGGFCFRGKRDRFWVRGKRDGFWVRGIGDGFGLSNGKNGYWLNSKRDNFWIQRIDIDTSIQCSI